MRRLPAPREVSLTSGEYRTQRDQARIRNAYVMGSRSAWCAQAVATVFLKRAAYWPLVVRVLSVEMTLKPWMPQRVHFQRWRAWSMARRWLSGWSRFHFSISLAVWSVQSSMVLLVFVQSSVSLPGFLAMLTVGQLCLHSLQVTRPSSSWNRTTPSFPFHSSCCPLIACRTSVAGSLLDVSCCTGR